MRLDSILIYCAGKGTRLRPFTVKNPKPLLKLDENLLLERLLKQIDLANFRVPIFINISYLASEFMAVISKMKINFRPKIIYEPDLLGTGYTTKKFLDLNFKSSLFIHGDLVFKTTDFLNLLSKIDEADSSTLITHLRKKTECRSIVDCENNKVKSILEIKRSQINTNKDLKGKKDVDVFSGLLKLIQIKNEGLNLELGDSVAPKLINQVALANGLQKLEFKGTRISVDSLQSYYIAKELDSTDAI